MDQRLRLAFDLVEPLRIKPGRKVSLRRDFDSGSTGDLKSEVEAAARVSEGLSLLVD